MTERFVKALERLVGNPSGYRYLLAVSGGADSCVMAHLFHSAGLEFAMAHCNFHLRGEDSNADMRLVQNLSAQLNIQLFVREFDTLSLQKNSGLSIEMMARQLRYDWFAEIAGPFDYIVTAHHANDAAETQLLNLCRGTGLKGLASIPEKNGKIIRPMLSFGAAEIRDYAQQQQIPYAVDITNSDETIKRNCIRHSVIPVLEKINPQYIQTSIQNREILQQQLSFYQHCMEEVKQKVLIKKEERTIIDSNSLENYPDKNLILYEILSDYGFPAVVVDQLAQKPQPGSRFFAPQYVLLVNRNEYIIQTKEVEDQDDVVIEMMDDLQKIFQVERRQGKPVFTNDNQVLFIPEEKLHFPLRLRHWQEGDSIYPLGAKGRQKLSDFFTDHKIDLFTKQKVWLLCDAEDIIWVVGYRSSEKYKIDSNTIKYYIITNYGNV